MYNRVITWETKKTDAGFEWHVYSFDHQVPAKTHARGTCPTRASAMAAAKRNSAYHKTQQRTQAAA